MTDWARIRAEFPSLAHWTYLNSATYGQVSRRATDAANRHFARLDEFAASDFLTWYDDADQIRAHVASLIGADPDDIAFAGTASAALAVLLNGIDWQPGDQVLTIEDEFPNNLYAPWFARGVEFIQCPWERFYDSIGSRTRLVLLSWLNYATGFRAPLEEIAPRLRERGILLYVDGTQGVGALRFDAGAIRPAMLAVHAYKWMNSPTGAGFFYVAPEVRPWLPANVIGWRSHHAWRQVDNLHHGKPEFCPAAEKYEGGGLPFTLLYAMEASIAMMLEIGPEAIERRVLGLAGDVRSILREAGATVQDGATPVVAGRFDGIDVSALARSLRERRVVVSARHGHLRVSPHFYNNEDDLERFRDQLHRCKGL
jgi:selenocysteine lyase/cysteine desulfurase